ncbi:MAG TPA: HEAT repeat domain-containing protein [Vicinamibacterales bacterium]|nr:HEAT repeat domain-containing protein [Vicinamibacterales bacterium]
MRESFPLLLTESLDAQTREVTHQHIESCAECADEWQGMKEAWQMMAELPELEPPVRARQRFLTEIGVVETKKTNVIPFHRRPAVKWLSQAAAVVILAGGSYLVGHQSRPIRVEPTGVVNVDRMPAAIQPAAFSIAETRTVNANSINPNIEGRPDIQNVQFVDANPHDDQIALSFDVTQHVTVTGAPNDKSMVRLMAYVMENEDQMSPNRSRAIDWVKQAYTDPTNADPEIAQALAKVLRNDTHEGVRIKAVDALAKLAASGQLDAAGVDTLRQKAMQDDENVYVRTKAAEALGKIQP